MDGSDHERGATSSSNNSDETNNMVDYIDYLFCERIVHGIQHRLYNHHIRNVDLRYENQAVIDHIIATRQSDYDDDDDDLPFDGARRSGRRERGKNNNSAYSSRRSTSNEIKNIGSSYTSSSSSTEDDMIFDLEL
mgnify:CR=1 FL=1